jgi:hypothetical protein
MSHLNAPSRPGGLDPVGYTILWLAEHAFKGRLAQSNTDYSLASLAIVLTDCFLSSDFFLATSGRNLELFSPPRCRQ